MGTAPLKLYASTAGFMKGRLVYTTYSSGCARRVHFQLNGLREGDIAEKYKVLGDLNERRFEADLAANSKPYRREVPFKWAIPGVNAIISGRIDFLVDGEIYELKSSDSKSSITRTYKGGQLKIENLAQIVIYMMAMEKSEARLVYSFYNPKGNLYIDSRTFVISIDNYGQIYIDGMGSQFNIQNVLKFLQDTADRFYDKTLADRPHNWSSKFESPCTYCAYAPICDAYDTELVSDHSDLLAYGKTILGDKQ